MTGTFRPTVSPPLGPLARRSARTACVVPSPRSHTASEPLGAASSTPRSSDREVHPGPAPTAPCRITQQAPQACPPPGGMGSQAAFLPLLRARDTLLPWLKGKEGLASWWRSLRGCPSRLRKQWAQGMGTACASIQWALLLPSAQKPPPLLPVRSPGPCHSKGPPGDQRTR